MEQRLADGFRDAVADEPPLGFDPDDIVDRLGQRRQRRLSVAAGAATAAVAVTMTVVTLGGGGGTGGSDQATAATSLTTTAATETEAPLVPPKPGAFEAEIAIDAAPGGMIRFDKAEPAFPANQKWMLDFVVLADSNGGTGHVDVMRGEERLAELPLGLPGEVTMSRPESITFQPGQKPVLAVTCAGDKPCRAKAMIAGHPVG